MVSQKRCVWERKYLTLPGMRNGIPGRGNSICQDMEVGRECGYICLELYQSDGKWGSAEGIIMHICRLWFWALTLCFLGGSKEGWVQISGYQSYLFSLDWNLPKVWKVLLSESPVPGTGPGRDSKDIQKNIRQLVHLYSPALGRYLKHMSRLCSDFQEEWNGIEALRE